MLFTMNGKHYSEGSSFVKNEHDDTNGWIFRIHDHHTFTCQEFVMKQVTFSFRRWLKYWIVLNILAFSIGLHTQDVNILWCLVAVLILGIFLKLHFKVKQESLLVISSLGVQITTTFASGRQLIQFFDASHIKDIIINEGITMHRVIFYLAILLNYRTEQKLIPLFAHSWPRLPILKEIYRGAQTLMHRKRDKQLQQSSPAVLVNKCDL